MRRHDLLKTSAVFEIQGVPVFGVVGMLRSVGDRIGFLVRETRGARQGVDRVEMEISLHQAPTGFDS